MAAVSGTGSARSADYARPSAGSSANPTDAAVPPTSSLPAAATAPELITNLHRAARAAGVTDSDPMLPLILALAQAIGFLDSRLAWNESLLGESSHRMLAAMQSATTTSAAEEKRLLAALHKAENEAANRLTRTVWGALERLLAACRSGVLGHWVDDDVGRGSWASGWRCAAEFVVAAILAASIGIWPPARRSIDGRSGAIWLRSRPPGRTSASCSTPWSRGSTRHGHCRGRATGTDGSQART